MAFHNTPKSSGPPIEARSDHRNPHVEARSHHTEQRPGSTPISTGPGARTDIPGYAESMNLRGHGDGRMRGVGHIVELPPDPRSGRLPTQLAGVQRHGSDGKAKPVMGPDKAAPAQNHAYRGESDVFTTVVSFQKGV